MLRGAVQNPSVAVVAMLQISWSRLFKGRAVPALLSVVASRLLQEREPAASSRGGTGNNEAVGRAQVGIGKVMSAVASTIGGSADADTPLMDAGLDSLGAVELRNQLQQAAGDATALPSTIVFDHPTARQLAQFLQPKHDEPLPTPASVCTSTVNQLSAAIFGSSVLLP